MKCRIQKVTALPVLRASENTLTQTSLWQRVGGLYLRAEARGFNPGHERDDWREGERELSSPMIDEDLAA